MQNIAGFFDKFKGKVAGQIQNLSIIIETIKKHTGIAIEMKDVAISAGIVRLKTTSTEKAVIFIKKNLILKEINQKTKSLVIKDIR